jgi:nonribosomal peptide synthetase protein VioG
VTAEGSLFEDELAAWASYNTVAALPHDRRSLHERLAEVDELYGDQPAIRCGERVLTYRKLRAAAQRCAAALGALGARAGTPVGLVADREIDSYVVVYAAVLLGAPYLPVDPRRPAAENAALLRRAGATVLVGAPEALTGLSAPDGPACVATSEMVRPPQPSAVALAEPGDDTLLYVIHTSGTTGAPKGVCIPRRAMRNLAGWYITRHGVSPGDRLTQNAPLTFDPSAQQIFAAWLAGACLDVMPEPVRRDPYLMVKWLGDRAITHLDMATTHWSHLCAAVAGEEVALPALRWAIVAGETMYATQARQWFQALGPLSRLNNIYGPTEATVNATELEVTVEELDRMGDAIPIGTPLPGYRLYAVDDRGELCPPQVPGEIVIAGAGVADGYLNDETGTAERFTVLRLQGQEPTRVYRTGDLAELVEVGPGRWMLSFRGRRDRQIKLSGYRVELDAVERAAQGCRGVDKAAVLVQGDPAERLALVYAGRATTDEVRAVLAATLASYVVVGAVLPVPAIPVTPAGKTDQQAVAALVDAADSASAPPARPSGTRQEIMAATWAAELGRADIPADVPFFALGGSSLAAFRIVAQLRRRGLDVRAADLLTDGTVAGCAALAAARETAAGASPVADLPRIKVGDWALWAGRVHHAGSVADELAIGPLTRVWAAGGPGPAPTAAILLDFDSRYDPGALARAVRETADAHPALRTRRSSRVSGALEQLPSAAPVPVVEVAGESAVEDARREIARMVAHGDGEARAVVAITPAGTRHVLLHLAHALVDGAALDRLTGEIVDRARGMASTGRSDPDLSRWYASVIGSTPGKDSWEAFRRADQKLARLAALHAAAGQVHTFALAAPDDTTAWRAALVVGRFFGAATVPVTALRPGPVRGAVPLANLLDAVPLLVAESVMTGPVAIRQTVTEALRESEGHCAAAAVGAGLADRAGWAHRDLPLVGTIQVQRAGAPGGPIGHGITSRLPGPEPVGDRVTVELIDHPGKVVVTIENLGEPTAEKLRHALEEATR